MEKGDLIREARKEELIFKLMNENSIASQTPVVLRNGFKISTIIISCPCCSQPSHPDHVKGKVSFPIRNVVVIDTAGYCSGCLILYPTLLRIRELGKGAQLERYTGSGWVVSGADDKKSSISARLCRFFGLKRE